MKRFYLCLAVAIIFCCVGIVYAKTPVVPHKTQDTAEISEDDVTPVKINADKSLKCNQKKALTGEEMVISFKIKGKSKEEVIAKIEQRLRTLGFPEEDIASFMSPAILYRIAPQLSPELGTFDDFRAQVQEKIRTLPDYIKRDLAQDKEKLRKFVEDYARYRVEETTPLPAIEGTSAAYEGLSAVSGGEIIPLSLEDYCRLNPADPICNDEWRRLVYCSGCNVNRTGLCALSGCLSLKLDASLEFNFSDFSFSYDLDGVWVYWTYPF